MLTPEQQITLDYARESSNALMRDMVSIVDSIAGQVSPQAIVGPLTDNPQPVDAFLKKLADFLDCGICMRQDLPDEPPEYASQFDYELAQWTQELRQRIETPPTSKATEQGKVTVTTNDHGECIAVTRTDDEHRVLSVIWIREATSKADTCEATPDEVIELAEQLIWVTVERAIDNTLATSSLFKEGELRTGMETACEEIKAWLGFEPTTPSTIKAEPTGEQS